MAFDLDDLEAAIGEGDGRRATDTAAAAGYERDLIFKCLFGDHNFSVR